MGRLAVLLVVCLSCREEPRKVAPVPSASVSAPPSASVSSDVTTHASTTSALDAAAPVASGVLDGDALRQKHLARVAADTSSVTILTGSSAPIVISEQPSADVPTLLATSTADVPVWNQVA